LLDVTDLLKGIEIISLRYRWRSRFDRRALAKAMVAALDDA